MIDIFIRYLLSFMFFVWMDPCHCTRLSTCTIQLAKSINATMLDSSEPKTLILESILNFSSLKILRLLRMGIFSQSWTSDRL